jgi:hypothetical protein
MTAGMWAQQLPSCQGVLLCGATTSALSYALSSSSRASTFVFFASDWMMLSTLSSHLLYYRAAQNWRSDHRIQVWPWTAQRKAGRRAITHAILLPVRTAHLHRRGLPALHIRKRASRPRVHLEHPVPVLELLLHSGVRPKGRHQLVRPEFCCRQAFVLASAAVELSHAALPQSCEQPRTAHTCICASLKHTCGSRCPYTPRRWCARMA